MRRAYDYLDPESAVKVRVFREDYQWSLDGIDGRGGYTERCWSFDTWEDAVAGIPAFVASFGAPAR